MKQNTRRPIFTVAFAALVFCFTLSCTKKGGNENNAISVGVFASLTGSEATFGISTKEGHDLAVEEINAAGGVKGRPIKLIVLDNRGLPEESATAVTRLITQHKVVSILGEVASSRSLAAAPIAQSHGIPMISPSSTSPKVTEVGDFIFRVCFIDPFQGYVVAKFARTNLNIRTAAILRDKKSDYSEGLANVFSEEFKKSGGSIVADLAYQSSDVDFKAQLTAIKAKSPEAIFVPGYYTDVGLIARQTRELGITVPLLGGDGWESSKLFEIGGPALMPAYISNHAAVDNPTPELTTFINKYEKKYGRKPDALAALAYDAANLLFDAMNRAVKIEPADIKTAIATTKDFKGVTGSITIDDKRNATKPAVMLKVLEKAFKYETTIEPLTATASKTK